MPKINDNEKKVLKVLAEAYHPDEWGAYSFAPLSRLTKLEIKDVRRACRSLAKKGLAVFERTLWNDDGPAGAGYRASEAGAAHITPCDVCEKRATYDYNVEDDGTQTENDDENTRRVLECDDHYKQSVKQKALAL